MNANDIAKLVTVKTLLGFSFKTKLQSTEFFMKMNILMTRTTRPVAEFGKHQQTSIIQTFNIKKKSKIKDHNSAKISVKSNDFFLIIRIIMISCFKRP